MKGSYGYVLTPSELTLENLFYTDGIGYISNSPNFIVDRSGFENYLIMSVISGKLHVKQHGVYKILTSSESCVLNLYDYHCYYSDTAEPCEVLWIHMNGKNISDFKKHIIDDKGINIVKIPQLYLLINQCLSLIENADSNCDMEVSMLIYKILLTLSFKNSHELTGDVSPNQDFFSEFDRYVQKNLDKKITLETLAQHFHLDKAYFCRKFKSSKGISPMQYIIDRKMQRAKYEVAYTSESIKNIAESLGYTDQNYFSHCFYKNTGYYPREYRLLSIQKSTDTVL